MKFEATGGSEDGKSYVKLKDKESITGVFRGDPYSFRKHWIENRSILCTESDCALCKAEPKKKPAFRFRLNFITKDPSGTYTPKIFEQGWNVWIQLKELHAEYDLEQTAVKITRSGSGLNDTSYTILPVKGGGLTPETNAVLLGIPLIDLVHKEESTPSISTGPNFGEADIPF